jgi:hypothetical protein
MPKDCPGSYANVEPSERDLNGTVNCLTCGSEGLLTERKVTSDGKIELQVEKHKPLPRTLRKRASPPKKDKPRDSRRRYWQLYPQLDKTMYETRGHPPVERNAIMHTAFFSVVISVVSLIVGLVGVLLGQMLSRANEHYRWRLDQKKVEYRQLVDLLYDTITVVERQRPGLEPPKDPQLLNNATQKLARMFADRMFIAKRLQESEANEKWEEMKKMIYYDPDLHDVISKNLHYSRTGLETKEKELRAKLIALANKDIVAFRWWSHGGD